MKIFTIFCFLIAASIAAATAGAIFVTFAPDTPYASFSMRVYHLLVKPDRPTKSFQISDIFQEENFGRVQADLLYRMGGYVEISDYNTVISSDCTVKTNQSYIEHLKLTLTESPELFAWLYYRPDPTKPDATPPDKPSLGTISITSSILTLKPGPEARAIIVNEIGKDMKTLVSCYKDLAEKASVAPLISN